MQTHIFKLKLGLLIIFILCSLNLYAYSNQIQIYLFSSPHCKVCLKLKKEFIPKILSKYKNEVELRELNVDEPKNLALLVYLFGQYYQGKKVMIPSVFVGSALLVGRKEIETNLDNFLHKYSKKKFSLPIFGSLKDLIEKFKSLSIFTVISAGLIDGINPCAFAVIVFFVSFLGVYGYGKKEVIYIGTSYVLSVFVTYILIGLGIFKVLYSLSHFYFLMKLFYYSVALLCFILAAFALYDYVRFKRTKQTDGLILQLPEFLKKRINLVIGAGMREKKYARIAELCLISLFVGFVVSLLEAACTGQVYIPIITFILKVPYLRLRAFIYLVLYNLMFVLPLIVIFTLSLIGVSSKQFNTFLKRNLGRVKIIMTVLFLTLGIFMLWLS